MPKITEITKVEDGPQSGHRPGRRPEEPRNFTVCFTVTKREKAAIDALSLCNNFRRSAILTEIVTRFMLAAENSPPGGVKRTALFDFLGDCQIEIHKKRTLFNSLAGEK